MTTVLEGGGARAFCRPTGMQKRSFLCWYDRNLTVLLCAGGMLLLELNRVLRPGGVFVWSATPVYQDLEEDKQLWNGSPFHS